MQIEERLAQTRENSRLIRERLLKIVCWTPETGQRGVKPPFHAEIIGAAKTIVMLDLALLKTEIDNGLYQKPAEALAKEIGYEPLPVEVGQWSSQRGSVRGYCHRLWLRRWYSALCSYHRRMRQPPPTPREPATTRITTSNRMAPIVAFRIRASMPTPSWMFNRGKSQSPMNAPRTPTIRSPMSPKLAPSTIFPANHPATIPTNRITIKP
jgi:hypothetical protein